MSKLPKTRLFRSLSAALRYTYFLRSGEVHQTTKNTAKIEATRPTKIEPKNGPIPACPSVELRMEYIPHAKDTFHAT